MAMKPNAEITCEGRASLTLADLVRFISLDGRSPIGERLSPE